MPQAEALHPDCSKRSSDRHDQWQQTKPLSPVDWAGLSGCKCDKGRQYLEEVILGRRRKKARRPVGFDCAGNAYYAKRLQASVGKFATPPKKVDLQWLAPTSQSKQLQQQQLLESLSLALASAFSQLVLLSTQSLLKAETKNWQACSREEEKKCNKSVTLTKSNSKANHCGPSKLLSGNLRFYHKAWTRAIATVALLFIICFDNHHHNRATSVWANQQPSGRQWPGTRADGESHSIGEAAKSVRLAASIGRTILPPQMGATGGQTLLRENLNQLQHPDERAVYLTGAEQSIESFGRRKQTSARGDGNKFSTIELSQANGRESKMVDEVGQSNLSSSQSLGKASESANAGATSEWIPIFSQATFPSLSTHDNDAASAKLMAGETRTVSSGLLQNGHGQAGSSSPPLERLSQQTRPTPANFTQKHSSTTTTNQQRSRNNQLPPVIRPPPAGQLAPAKALPPLQSNNKQPTSQLNKIGRAHV